MELIITCIITFIIGLYIGRPAREPKKEPRNELRELYEYEHQLAIAKAKAFNEMCEAHERAQDEHEARIVAEGEKRYQELMVECEGDESEARMRWIWEGHGPRIKIRNPFFHARMIVHGPSTLD